MSQVLETPVAEGPPAASSRAGALRRIVVSQQQALVGLLILLLFVGVALVGPLLLDQGAKTKVGDVFEEPSSAHLLGLDGGGADVLALLVDGARVSLIVGFAAASVSTLIGGLVGLLSGFFGGKTDTILMR